nr:IQ and AAA domain-containing protein 1-like [Helicoverpa armigera]
MSLLKLPVTLTNTIEVQNKWLEILQHAEEIVEEDAEYLHHTEKGMRLKERALPPEILGRNYAKYCDLINKLYDAYLNSVHLQRAPYIQEIINVCIKRMFELRTELTHVIVNDYIYVDGALTQMRLTPADIQIVVPYHFPLESRSENVEQALQKMWTEAIRRKKKRERPKKAKPPPPVQRDSWLLPPAPTVAEDAAAAEPEESEEEEETPPPSVHTLIPEIFIQTLTIQRHERFRQWRMADLRSQAAKRTAFHLEKHPDAPIEMKMKAGRLIQKVYREYMKIKRERVKDTKRDILLGLIPDPFRSGPSFFEENNKVYERRRQTRLKITKAYLKELERENIRLLTFRKGDQIDDITDEIRTWFKEWFYGYNYFPEFPYEIEGGTILVVRGDFPTVQEKLEDDEKKLAESKGRTPDQIKEEKARAKEDAKLKAQLAKEAKKKEEETLVKARCNPFTDPGYRLQESHVMHSLMEALRNYRSSWSLFDELPAENYGDVIYGYMKPLLTEELMKEIHLDCRKYVDELMRLDLKMLIKMHQQDFKKIGWKYPKIKPRKKPKKPPVHKPLIFDEKLLKNSEGLFDIGIVTKPTTKLHDIIGDTSYAAYEFNIRDPDATYPLPGVGDIRNRLMLSCILGCGIQHGAPRKKAVMLLGPERNGKSFMADAVAGELNAIKIDITPEVFTAVISRPQKMLSQVFTTARAFQPAVVFMKNVERVFTVKDTGLLSYREEICVNHHA